MPTPVIPLAVDPENETLASALNNFILNFYGAITKTVVNGGVVWVLPCDLAAALPGYPRDPSIGTACYFKEVLADHGVLITQAQADILFAAASAANALAAAAAAQLSADGAQVSANDAQADATTALGQIAALGTMSAQNSNSVSVTGGTITGAAVTGLAAPSVASDAATKQYADSLSGGIIPKDSVASASTANLTLSGEQTIDGVLTSATRILVKNQTAPAENGIYVTAAGAWARAADANSAPELLVNQYYFVTAGTVNASTGWFISTAPTVLDVDPVSFSQFSAASTYTAGAGLTLTGSQFSVAGTVYVVGDLPYASTTTALSRLAAVGAGQLLASNGVGAAPFYTASPSVTAITVSTNSLLGGLVVKGDQINQYTTDALDSVDINYDGFNGGTTRFRDLIVYDGKNAQVAKFDGQLKSLAVVGPLSTTSLNKVVVTAPATGSTLTIAEGATLSAPSSATVSGTNTGDNSANTLYSGLVTNATHSGDATGATALTLATVNGNVGSFGSATQASVVTVNAKGLVTAVSNATVTPAIGSVTGLGTNVGTALAVAVGTDGAFVVKGGALGTPLSGTVTNLTGTASININGTVGATTPGTGSFTTLSATGATSITDATDSTSSTTGALKVTGGLGVAKRISAGGRLSIILAGSDTAETSMILLSGTQNGTGTSYGALYQATLGAATTTWRTYASAPVNAAGALTECYHYLAQNITLGAGSVLNQTGFYCGNLTTFSNTSYGFRGTSSSGAGKYNLFMDGTAQNYLAGETMIGSSTDMGAYILQVTGNTRVAGTLDSTGTATLANLTLKSDQINQHVTNGLGQISLNYEGYQNGITQFRDLVVYDGKNAQVAKFDGQLKTLTLAGYLVVDAAIADPGINIYASSVLKTQLYWNGSSTIVGSYANAPVGIQVNGAIKVVVHSAGLEVTGTVSATGAFSNTTDAVKRTTKGNFNLGVNVKDYGAVGDGATNDTAAINSAIAALTDYSTLYFPGGSYLVTLGGLTALENLDYITIYGNGARLYSTTTGAPGNFLVVESTCTHIDIHDLAFVGSATSRGSGIGVRLYGNYSSISNCFFSGTSDFAILVSGNGAGTAYNTGSRVENNTIVSPQGDGVHIGCAADFVVANNVIRSTGDDAIGIISDSAGYPPVRGVVVGNHIYSAGSAGIRINEADELLVTGNQISASVAAGIECNRYLSTTAYNDRIVIQGNKLHGTMSTGGPRGAILMNFCNASSVKDNVVWDPVNGSGIVLADFNDLQVTGNVVRGVPSRGIATNDTDDWLLTAGAFVVGATYYIRSVGTTDFTLIGAAANTVGLAFTASGAGTGTGTASQTKPSWDNLVISNNVLPYVVGNEAIYVVQPAGVTLTGLVVTGNNGLELPAGNWIYYDRVTNGRIYFNTSRDTDTVAGGGTLTNVTAGNNI